MPTAFWIDTTKKARMAVTSGKLDEIDEYIVSNLTNEEFYLKEGINIYIKYNDRHAPRAIFLLNDNFNEINSKIHHIAIVAVELNKPFILEHLKDRLKVSYVPTSNSYSLLLLSIDVKNRQMIDLLCRIADENKEDIERDLCYTSRQTIHDEYDLDWIDYFVEKNISLWNMYHFSIVWNKPIKTKYLLQTYNWKIDIKWTSNALEIAKRFESKDSLQFFANEGPKWLKYFVSDK
jgi:hypothetical protein